ncbi:MAG: hypothetical protein EOP56_02375 [Sphingobacteriales bacterium]|nr:MAG: hypothetical protein EOP56_02375 [Sphingobacteriales bacterium]
MRYILTLLFVFNILSARAQAPCESKFTLHKDKRGQHTWIMHTSLKLSNWTKDTATVELRLQKMRDRNDKWVIVLSVIDNTNKCVKEGAKAFFKFTDNSEPGYANPTGNCEGVYQVEMPIASVGTSMGSNKLKNLLRKKRLVSISLENAKGFTDGIMAEEEGEELLDIINCMLDE